MEDGMKRILLAALVAALVIGVAGITFAGTVTATPTVSANVIKKCGTITPSNLTLTDIDPTSTSDAVSSGTATTVQCTKNSSYTVTAASGGGAATGASPLHGTMTNSGKTLAYELAFTTGFTGNGFGTATATTLVAGNGLTVKVADFQAAEAITYSDTVTITVTY
jgi:spore coat protein U-like protein